MIHLRKQHLDGQIGGMVSVCSSHPTVLQAAMELAASEKRPILVEATPNQVNLSGGYTGMTPLAFSAFIRRLSAPVGLPAEQIIIGADHLGPHVWKKEDAAIAMTKAAALASHCVAAGFRKIHLDTGMCCADDSGPVLPPEIAASRAVQLCLAAENAASDRPDCDRPWYVIGNEVPPPGGGLEDIDLVTITRPDILFSSIKIYENAFCQSGLSSAWQRVIAVVAQPGVEFGDRVICPYDHDRATALSACHSHLPNQMTFEIHATDYQTPDALKQMVADHFILLKTGPCLTFAFREAVYALARIEDACPGISVRSHLRQVMENLMMRHPEHWRAHYPEDTAESLRFLLHYSFRDRIRYYWTHPEAMAAWDQLIQNLKGPIPEALLRQFLPDLLPEIKNGTLSPEPLTLVKRRIQNALKPYLAACRQKSL